MRIRRIILLAILVVMSVNLFAEKRGIGNTQAVYIEKGTKSVGLSFGYDSWRASGNDGVQLLAVLSGIRGDVSMADVSANAAWFFKDNLSVGVRLGYNDLRLQVDSLEFASAELKNRNYKKQAFNGSVTCRGYLPLFDGKVLAMFAEGRLSGQNGYVKSYENTDRGKEGTYADVYELSFGLYPGVSVYVTEHVSFEVLLPLLETGYYWQDQTATKSDDGQMSHTFVRFKPNLVGLRMGVQYHF